MGIDIRSGLITTIIHSVSYLNFKFAVGFDRQDFKVLQSNGQRIMHIRFCGGICDNGSENGREEDKVLHDEWKWK